MRPGKDVFFGFIVLWYTWLFGQMMQTAEEAVQKRSLEPQTLETLFALMSYAFYFVVMTKIVLNVFWPPEGAPSGGGAQFEPEEQS